MKTLDQHISDAETSKGPPEKNNIIPLHPLSEAQDLSRSVLKRQLDESLENEMTDQSTINAASIAKREQDLLRRRKPLVEQIDDILADGDRHKIHDTRKQLLFGVDLIDTWLGRNT